MDFHRTLTHFPWGAAMYGHVTPLREHGGTMDVHLVWGDKDEVVPTRFHELWKEVIPHCKVTLVDGGHSNTYFIEDHFPLLTSIIATGAAPP